MLFLFADITHSSIQELIQYVQLEKIKWKIPGTVFIGIIYDNKQETFFIGEDADINPQTLLPVSSLSKAMTAQIIGALVKKGVIRLEDPISKYLPDLKLPYKTPLRIIDVLSQKTGFYNFSGDSLLKLGFSKKEIVSEIFYFKVKNRPQIDYSYNNIPMGLLEMVVEKATGKKFNDVAKEYLFIPLQMNSATYDTLQKKSNWWGCTRTNKHLPTLYIYEKEGAYQKISPDFSMGELFSSMGAALTSADLMRWLSYCITPLSKNIVLKDFIESSYSSHASFDPKSYDIQFALPRLNGSVHYGLNWFHMMYGAHKIYFHMGGWLGVRSYIAFDPIKKCGLVIWHNYGSLDVNLFPEAIRGKFFDTLYNYPNHDWVSEIEVNKRNYRKKIINEFNSDIFIPTPSLSFERLLGKYSNKIYGVIEIEQNKEALYMKYRRKKIKLKHHNNNKFVFDPKEINPSFDHAFPQWIAFGQNKTGEMILQNSLMLDGDDPLFVRE